MTTVRFPRRSVLRALTVLAVVTAGAGTVAGPAAAQTDPGWVSGWLNDLTVGAAGAPGRSAPLDLSSSGATAPRVTVDLSGLAGVATASFPKLVRHRGHLGDLPDAAGGDPGRVRHRQRHGAGGVPRRPGAVDGATGTLDYTVRADGLEPYTQQATVSVRSGADVLDLVDEYVLGAEVGDVHAVPVAVVNAGDQPAEDLRVTFRFPVGLHPVSYRNCRYGTDPVLATVVVCTVRGTFAPGIRHELRNGFATTVGPAALGDKRITQFVEPLATAGPLPGNVRLTRREADRALRRGRSVGRSIRSPPPAPAADLPSRHPRRLRRRRRGRHRHRCRRCHRAGERGDPQRRSGCAGRHRLRWKRRRVPLHPTGRRDRAGHPARLLADRRRRGRRSDVLGLLAGAVFPAGQSFDGPVRPADRRARRHPRRSQVVLRLPASGRRSGRQHRPGHPRLTGRPRLRRRWAGLGQAVAGLPRPRLPRCVSGRPASRRTRPGARRAGRW